MGLVLAAILLPAAQAQETYEMLIYVRGMSCRRCVGTVEHSLRTVPGLHSVKLVDFDKGSFRLLVKETSTTPPSELKKKCGRFAVTKVEIALRGTVAAPRGEVWFTARKSGWRLRLLNPPSAKRDLVEGLRARAATGPLPVRVEGEVREIRRKGERGPVFHLILQNATPIKD